MGREAWIPPYDDWAKEAETKFWFGKWRHSSSQLGFGFLHQDGRPRPQYSSRDDWSGQEFPVDYDAPWARGRKAWQVWLDAFDAWDHERKRLCEVYLRRSEAAGSDTLEGKFPKAPAMCCKAKSVPQNKNPKEPPALRFSRPTASQNEFWHLGTGYQAAFDGDVARLADLLEDEDVDVCCRDHNLQTPLMLAALGGSLECVEYLVDARADVAAVDRQKDTAFDVAIAEHSDRFPDHPVLLYFQSARPQA